MTTSLLERDLYCLRRAGFLVINNYVASAVVDRLDQISEEFNDEIARFTAAGGAMSLRYHWPLTTTRCLYALSTDIQDVAMDPRIQAIVTGYLANPQLRDCVLHRNMPDPRNAARGVAAAVSYHRDALWSDAPIVPMYLHVFLLLTDFTVENGATLIVPGSHLSREPGYYFKHTDKGAQQEGVEYRVFDKGYFGSAIHINALRGSLIFIDGMTIHTPGTNVSGSGRSQINLTFKAAAAPAQPALLNAKYIARNHARVPIRQDFFNLLEEDADRPSDYGPLGNPWPVSQQV